MPKLMKLCVKCNSLVSWNYYFQAYICRECNYRETVKEENKEKKE